MGLTLYSWGLKVAFSSRSLQRKKLQSVSPKINKALFSLNVTPFFAPKDVKSFSTIGEFFCCQYKDAN